MPFVSYLTGGGCQETVAGRVETHVCMKCLLT